MNFKYSVDTESSGKTVKYILKNKLEFSQKLIRQLKYQNKIFLNGKSVFVNKIINKNDIIEVDMNLEEKSEGVIPEDIPINIIYEDEALIALNKQPGVIVHPTCNHSKGTLANAISYHFAKNKVLRKIRPVMRLDRDTSGVIIFAKNSFSQDFLIKQMNNNSFYKEYTGIVNGLVKTPHGTINFPISRKPGSIIERCTSSNGEPSVTHYKVIEHLKNATLLSFVLETGRTHQIRVHCESFGHPLLGDTLYNNLQNENLSLSEKKIFPLENCIITSKDFPSKESVFIDRQALHSSKAAFIHPVTKKLLQLTAPLPYDIKKLKEILRK
ncbi:RluA family pseudouridine synthase [Herbivorax sp. ANBcel31]|uniref:RluA family pseudouridine synthase n=1 Tax=Herbivorax sp. ANBcel31 TaxID=3069754 RepID=UPI0027B2E6BB|nr:RluA family pseudouridine synthase [Herbivorax sp. ANBcel31]MDQ2086624.1 RluA family pseudouridine synthase [Herbivorax sp. ANBcel31]